MKLTHALKLIRKEAEHMEKQYYADFSDLAENDFESMITDLSRLIEFETIKNTISILLEELHLKDDGQICFFKTKDFFDVRFKITCSYRVQEIIKNRFKGK